MQKATLHTPVSWRKPSAKPTQAECRARAEKRDAWLQQIDPAWLFHRLFDAIPGVYFFAKNRRGELMFLCQATRDLHHIEEENSVVGMTDFDLNPADMAQAYVNDDAHIYATGEPLLNRVELWFDRDGMPDWFLVNKMPIRSRAGKIIGIMGFSQNYEGRTKLLAPFPGIAKAVNHLRENYRENLTITALAQLVGLSPRQMERKFKAVFGVGPQRFLIKTRLMAACRALRETDQSLAEIGMACGFTDQSAFSRHFRHDLGLTPTAFRLREKVA